MGNVENHADLQSKMHAQKRPKKTLSFYIGLDPLTQCKND